MSLLTTTLAGWIFTTLAAAPENSWPQFRGPAGDGQLKEVRFPTKWDESTNIAWKVPIPGAGWSQPVVTGDKIFVTTAVSEKSEKPKNMSQGTSDTRSMFGNTKPPETVYRWEVICLDAKTGQILWEKVAAEQKPGIPIHPSNTYATETPATDGKHVFAYFAPIGKVVSFDLDGNLIWEVNVGVGPIANGMGTGSSPITLDGKLILQSDNEEKSFLLALDGSTGKEDWKVERGKGTSWSSPYVWRNKDREELIVCGASKVESYDPASGKLLWNSTSIKSGFSASPVGNSEMLFVGNSPPLSTSPLLAVKAGATGDITLPKGTKSSEWTPWSRLKSGPGLSSPILVGDLLYIATDSFLNCYDTKSGERLYRERLPEARHIVACPWVAGDEIFFLDEDGHTFVVKAGPAFQLLGVNKLDDVFWASPAIAGDMVLLRGVDKLYAIRQVK